MARSDTYELPFQLHVTWWTDATDTYTVVTLESAEGAQGRGVAKRNPGDTYDADTGLAIAMKRALHDLAEDIEVPGDEG